MTLGARAFLALVAALPCVASAQGLPSEYFRPSEPRKERVARMMQGAAHVDGRGVAQDRAKGLQMILAEANRVTITHRAVVALAYAHGVGGPVNVMEAARAMGARPENDAQAQFAVGRLHHEGFWYGKEERPIVDWILGHLGATPEQLDAFYRAQQDGGSYRWASWDRAVTWYRRSAEAGFVGGQVNLGLIMLDPKGPAFHCGEAVRWLRRAAEGGDATAMLNLGSAYNDGPHHRAGRIGILFEPIAAGGLLVKEVVAGGAAARAGLREGDVLLKLDGTELLDGKLLIEKTQRAADQPLRLVVRPAGGSAVNDIALATEACPGGAAEGLRIDAAQALQWHQKAADAGHPAGLFFVAAAYREGKGVARDPAKALALYKQGAERGDWEAAQAVAHMYASGEGVEKDQTLSEEWFRRAIRLKHQSRGR